MGFIVFIGIIIGVCVVGKKDTNTRDIKMK